ncbi:MAG: restriction endonuclease subunit S [bacterium]|nr:restriction endonuclease subunit S [bacterium]
MEHIESGSRRLLSTIPASEMKSSAFHFHPGDVLYGRLRPYLNKVFYATFEGLCSSEFIVLPQSEAHDSRFLAMYLSTDGFVEFANQLNKGDRPRVSWDQISDHNIPLPPRHEQERIADGIEILSDRIGECQQRLERIPILLKRFRQSILAAACSGKLTENWRATCSADEWSEETVGTTTREIRTGPFGSALHKSDYITGGIPVINPMHLVDGRIISSSNVTIGKVTLQRLKEYSLRLGDIVIARRGEMGRCAVTTIVESGWICGTGSAIVRFKSQVVPEFAQMQISSPESRAYLIGESNGTTMDNLNQRIFAAMPFQVPSVKEQHEIIKRVEHLFALADQIEARYQRAKAHVDKLTPAILAKAFRGELVPQDPNDEPAEKLLERIRAARGVKQESKAASKEGKSARPKPRKKIALTKK